MIPGQRRLDLRDTANNWHEGLELALTYIKSRLSTVGVDQRYLQRRLVSLLLRRFMNAAYFEEQRQDMVAAIRAITDHMAAQLGKTALDERVLGAMAKVPRHEFVPVEVQPYAYLNI